MTARPQKKAKILISKFFSFNFYKWSYMAHSHTIHPAVLSSANVSLLMKKAKISPSQNKLPSIILLYFDSLSIHSSISYTFHTGMVLTMAVPTLCSWVQSITSRRTPLSSSSLMHTWRQWIAPLRHGSSLLGTGIAEQSVHSAYCETILNLTILALMSYNVVFQTVLASIG